MARAGRVTAVAVADERRRRPAILRTIRTRASRPAAAATADASDRDLVARFNEARTDRERAHAERLVAFRHGR